jgi:hypothetical protein
MPFLWLNAVRQEPKPPNSNASIWWIFAGFCRVLLYRVSAGIALITRPSVRSADAFALAEKQKSVKKVRCQALSGGRRHPQPGPGNGKDPCEAAAGAQQARLSGYATNRAVHYAFA